MNSQRLTQQHHIIQRPILLSPMWAVHLQRPHLCHKWRHKDLQHQWWGWWDCAMAMPTIRAPERAPASKKGHTWLYSEALASVLAKLPSSTLHPYCGERERMCLAATRCCCSRLATSVFSGSQIVLDWALNQCICIVYSIMK